MKVILGNGISAKIFAFYNPEYVRIAPSGGGQMDKKAFVYTAFLHRNSWSDEFLDDIGVKTKAMEISMGHWYKNEAHLSLPDGEAWKEFLRKKLSGLVPPPSLFPKEALIAKPYLKSSLLSTYGTPLKKIIKALEMKLQDRRIVDAKAVNITDDMIDLDSGESVKYSHLVSTIPAPVFWKIYSGECAEKKIFHSNSLFVQTMEYATWLNMGYPELTDKFICYFPESKYPFDRVGRLENLYGDNLFIEGSVKFAKSVEIENARLIRNYGNTAPPLIMFLGRYAEWNPDIMVHHVVARSANKYMLESIWSDQKSFNKEFVTYSPEIEYVQMVVKDYILHLISEIDSLLNTINWKMKGWEKRDKKVKREAILEEWIDIFKFWLSIGLMFGFSVEDFGFMYWEKSEIIRRKHGNLG